MTIEVEGLAPLLMVFDMPTSLAFYRDGLGFEVVARSQPRDDCGWAWLRLGHTDVMLNTAYDDGERPAGPDQVRLAAHLDTCLYFSCPDVDGAYGHLKAQGIESDPPKVAYYGMRQLYVTDPDGYNLCFQWKAIER